MALAPGDRFGPYEIRGPLGAGGMGEVYLARDSRLGRDVALKLLPEARTADPVARRRLLDEARTIARLDHPNLCAIYEVGEHEGRVFLALQRIAGETLEDRLARGALAEGDALPIASQVAAGVAHAHAASVLHRDLKPRNVMVTPEGRAIVLDFGIARAEESGPDDATRTLAGQSSGTPSAMSPEQARGEPLDARTDVFSFGAMFYRMLSGRDPFARGSSAESIAAVLGDEPSALRTASPELARIVHKCLEKDRALRYGAMNEVSVDLERLRHGRAPASVRRRGMAWAAFALVLALAAVALVVWRPWQSAPRVRALAVLPFRSLAPGGEENYLGLGIADAVITRMSQDPGLLVRPTSAVRRYAGTETSTAQAAKELGVDAILEGTWQREGDRLRVTANLLRRSDGASLWSDRFDATSGDVFAIQDSISDRLSDRLRTRLVGTGHPAATTGGTRNSQAYEAYAKGLYYFSERGFQPADRGNSDQATRLFQEAVRLDPGFARAHAQLAFAHMWTALFIEQDSTLVARAEGELATAERLDPGLALVPLVRSQIVYSRYRGWRMAEGIAMLRRARALEPGIGELEWSDFAIHLGLVDEWEKAMKRAIEQDPLNHRLRTTYVNNAYLLSLPEKGRKLQKELLDQEPDLRYWAGVGDVARSAPLIERFVREQPEDALGMLDLGFLRALQGRCTEADSVLRLHVPRIVRDRAYHHWTFEAAQAYGQCGDAKNAARWLEETVRWGFPALPLFERDPFLAPIRKSPEFTALLARLRPEWQRDRDALLAD